jgi:hypothetical protein
VASITTPSTAYLTGRYRGTTETLVKLQKVLERAGVEFFNGKRPGVRLLAHR